LHFRAYQILSYILLSLQFSARRYI
jgi:hypothetical protein